MTGTHSATNAGLLSSPDGCPRAESAADSPGRGCLAPGRRTGARGVALRAGYTTFAVGEPWGKPWATTWFRTEAVVPERCAGRRVEALFDLGSGGPEGRAEGLVHDEHGTPLQGLHPHLGAVLVAASAAGGERVRLLVEAAANPYIEGGSGTGVRYGDPVTAGDTPLYRLRRADLAVRDEEVWQLVNDVEALDGLMRALPADLPRRHEIRAAPERAADAVDPRAVVRTAARARAVLAPLLARHAHESAHTLAAVGHAHIDSAWLWPVRETVRKCAHTFSTMAALTEEYPGLVVAALRLDEAAPSACLRADTQDRRGRRLVTGGRHVGGGRR
jgi:alpha-mannosidase